MLEQVDAVEGVAVQLQPQLNLHNVDNNNHHNVTPRDDSTSPNPRQVTDSTMNTSD